MSQPPKAPEVNVQKTKAYYVPQGIPAELPENRNGKVVGTFSIIFGVISLLFYPIIFGPIGIILGVMSKKRGAHTLGIAGIIISAMCMAFGMFLGFLFYSTPDTPAMILPSLF